MDIDYPRLKGGTSTEQKTGQERETESKGESCASRDLFLLNVGLHPGLMYRMSLIPHSGDQHSERAADQGQ